MIGVAADLLAEPFDNNDGTGKCAQRVKNVITPHDVEFMRPCDCGGSDLKKGATLARQAACTWACLLMTATSKIAAFSAHRRAVRSTSGFSSAPPAQS